MSERTRFVLRCSWAAFGLLVVYVAIAVNFTAGMLSLVGTAIWACALITAPKKAAP